MSKLMTVREVADYLNIKERKVYDLVHRGEIPCSRVGRKWIFPQHLIDEWVARDLTRPGAGRGAEPAPPIVAGSHDPLLEWSLRQSGCGLGAMPGGSLDGLRRLAAGEARVCALHVLDPESGTYNVPAVRRLALAELVLLEWAVRRQGLLVPPGNPLGLRGLADLRDRRPRFVAREAESGTAILLAHLLAQAGLDEGAVAAIPDVARSQTEVGLAILEGHADAGLAVEAVALQLRLDFLPLHEERFDLALRRRDYFEPPIQELLAFTRGPAFAEKAAALGYGVANLGRVHYNAP